MKLWTITLTPLLSQHIAGSRKVCDIPPEQIIDTTDYPVSFDDGRVVWQKVFWRDFEGWTYQDRLEVYNELFPGNIVQLNSTVEDWDLAQYIRYEGHTKYNMCGEICVAKLVGLPLQDVLDRWKTAHPNFYKRIYWNDYDRGTSPDDLMDLLGLFGRSSALLQFATKNITLGRSLVSPGIFRELLTDFHVIIGVKISKANGELRTTGVLHWVELTGSYPDGINRGYIEIFNPAVNRLQSYSYREFAASFGVPYGLVVSRNA